MRLHRHTWEPHPQFNLLNELPKDGEPLVRRCTRCMRVEDRAFGRGEFGISKSHLQPPRDRLRRLQPFGLWWEINTIRPSTWSWSRAERKRAGAWFE